jgi:capsular polysaccharide biosynthesis protein
VNSGEVESVLRDAGFAVLHPEDLPLPEQIRRFATASVIVGQHGAGLTNCLYAPGASVVELHGGYGGGEYFSMCRVLGQPYHLVRCRPRGDDVLVDIDDLRAMVTRLR